MEKSVVKNILGLMVFLLILSTAAVQSYQDAIPEVKVRFHHKKHVKTAGLTCNFCHKFQGSGAKMNLPRHEDCRGCHDIGKAPSCVFCHEGRVGAVKPPSHSRRWLIDHGRNAYDETQKSRCRYCHSGEFKKSCKECHKP